MWESARTPKHRAPLLSAWPAPCHKWTWRNWRHEMRIKKTHDTVLHRGVLDFGKLQKVGTPCRRHGHEAWWSTWLLENLELPKPGIEADVSGRKCCLSSCLAWTWKGMALQRPVSFHYQSFGNLVQFVQFAVSCSFHLFPVHLCWETQNWTLAMCFVFLRTASWRSVRRVNSPSTDCLCPSSPKMQIKHKHH